MNGMNENSNYRRKDSGKSGRGKLRTQFMKQITEDIDKSFTKN